MCVMLGELKGTCDTASAEFVRNVLFACNYLKTTHLLTSKMKANAAKYVCTFMFLICHRSALI